MNLKARTQTKYNKIYVEIKAQKNKLAKITTDFDDLVSTELTTDR